MLIPPPICRSACPSGGTTFQEFLSLARNQVVQQPEQVEQQFQKLSFSQRPRMAKRSRSKVCVIHKICLRNFVQRAGNPQATSFHPASATRTIAFLSARFGRQSCYVQRWFCGEENRRSCFLELSSSKSANGFSPRVVLKISMRNLSRSRRNLTAREFYAVVGIENLNLEAQGSREQLIRSYIQSRRHNKKFQVWNAPILGFHPGYRFPADIPAEQLQPYGKLFLSPPFSLPKFTYLRPNHI